MIERDINPTYKIYFTDLTHELMEYLHYQTEIEGSAQTDSQTVISHLEIEIKIQPPETLTVKDSQVKGSGKVLS